MSELLFVTKHPPHFFLDQRESPVCIRNPDYERLLRGGSGTGFHSARVPQHWTKERRKGCGHHPQLGGVSKSAYWREAGRWPRAVGRTAVKERVGRAICGAQVHVWELLQTGVETFKPRVTTWSPFFQALTSACTWDIVRYFTVPHV